MSQFRSGTSQPDVSLQKMLQQSILQLCSDNVFYRSQLQVLGIICLTIDGEPREVVIKINSTLKRVHSLPPNLSLLPQLPQMPLIISPKVELNKNSNEENDDNMDLVDSNDIAINDNMRVDIELGRRVRKQKRPIKACTKLLPLENGSSQNKIKEENIDDGNEEFSDCNEAEGMDNDKEKTPVGDRYKFKLSDLLNKKTNLLTKMDKTDGKIQCMNNSFETQFLKINNKDDNSTNNNHIDDEKYEAECLDLTLRNQPDRNLEYLFNLSQTEMGALATMSQFFTDPYKQINLNQLLSKQYLNAFEQSGLLGPQYRNIRSTGEASTSSLLPLESLSSTPDADLVVDRLNSDTSGRKRRRRGLDDALTSDEIIEYLGFKEEENSSSVFVCPICHTTEKEVLKYFHHTLLAHRSFVCHECGRCFSTKSSLLRHRPIHTGLRRYACAICQKAFYRKDKCKAHVKRHIELRMMDQSVANAESDPILDETETLNETINDEDSPEHFEEEKSNDIVCVA